MPPRAPDIDFKNIRALRGDRKHGFEELVCQLGRLDRPTADAQYFRNDGAGGDGGVEAYWTLADGRKIGYQAKYHLRSGEIDWVKIDNSVRTAKRVHPTLRSYVIAFPCNLTSPTARRQKSGKDHWDEYVTVWKSDFPRVEFARWDESELLGKLTQTDPAIVGIRAWFFDFPDWTTDWFRQRFERAAQNLGDRYHADEHVIVEVAEVFEGLARSPVLKSMLNNAVKRSREICRQIPTDISLIAPKYTERVLQRVDLRPGYRDAAKSVARLKAINNEYPIAVADALPIKIWQARIEQANTAVRHFARQGWPRGYYTKRATMLAVGRLGSAVDYLSIVLRSDPFRADCLRAVLLVGPAGTGKSHLLADVADRATREGRPAILLLGQHFTAAEPWGQIKAQMDAEHFSNDQMLGALDAAAEAANMRALILIDALNESEAPGKWKQHLAGLIATILRFPRLAVAVSCRSEYLDWVVPEPLRAKFVKVECEGFISADEQEHAAQIFLDSKGIARPAVPWLAPDFTNPLFLRVTSEGLKATGQRSYPQFVGLTNFFAFFLDSLAARPPFDQWQGPNLLCHCLLAIAREMLRGKRAWLGEGSAIAAINAMLAEHEGVGNGERALKLFKDLKRGALLSLPDPQSPRPTRRLIPVPEGVIFVFQRLGDLLMAEAVIDDIDASSFTEGGNLAFVDQNPEVWAGFLDALAILLPERKGMELLDLRLGLRCSEAAQLRFKDSLIWRTGCAFLPTTEGWFDRLDDDQRLEVFIRLSPVPDHPWNADRLDVRLRGITMPDRDVIWSTPLARASGGADQAIKQIIDWALGGQCHRATDETLRLTATALAWMLTTSALSIRDRATKALARLFLLRPSVMTAILKCFHDVDDLYLVERLWAVAYEAAMNGLGDQPLGDLALQTWRLCFAAGRPPISLHTRDHALGIVELAKARNILPSAVALDCCRPPFRTTWPLEEVSEEFVEAASNIHGDMTFLWSVTNFGALSRDKVRSELKRWSSVPLDDPVPNGGQPRYDQQRAERWLVKRVLDLGWTAERFAGIDRGLETSKRRSLKNRFGKKYLWIAVDELFARLSDNVYASGEPRMGRGLAVTLRPPG